MQTSKVQYKDFVQTQANIMKQLFRSKVCSFDYILGRKIQPKSPLNPTLVPKSYLFKRVQDKVLDDNFGCSTDHLKRTSWFPFRRSKKKETFSVIWKNECYLNTTDSRLFVFQAHCPFGEIIETILWLKSTLMSCVLGPTEGQWKYNESH